MCQGQRKLDGKSEKIKFPQHTYQALLIIQLVAARFTANETNILEASPFKNPFPLAPLLLVRMTEKFVTSYIDAAEIANNIPSQRLLYARRSQEDLEGIGDQEVNIGSSMKQ